MANVINDNDENYRTKNVLPIEFVARVLTLRFMPHAKFKSFSRLKNCEMVCSLTVASPK